MIKGTHIRLRPATLEDQRMIYGWYNASDIASFLHPSSGPYETFDTWCDDWKEYYFTDESPRLGRMFVILHEHSPVGTVAYNDIDPENRVELDIWMDSEANCGKGFGPDAKPAANDSEAEAPAAAK